MTLSADRDDGTVLSAERYRVVSRAGRCCQPGGTVLSADRDGVVSRARRCCQPGGTVLSAECGIGGERIGVDVDRPVRWLDYRFVVVGCSDCEFRCSV